MEDEVYDNYRVIQGIPTPYTVTRYFNGDMAGQRFMSSVGYNQGINDSQFQPSLGTSAKPSTKPERERIPRFCKELVKRTNVSSNTADSGAS